MCVFYAPAGCGIEHLLSTGIPPTGDRPAGAGLWARPISTARLPRAGASWDKDP